jgi:macrolide-specific efflux system membrane fusion protein
MKLKLLAVLVLVLVGAASVFIALGGLPASAATNSTFLTSAVTVTDVSDDVAATGTIASTATWDLAFGAAAALSSGSDASSSSTGAGNTTGTWRVGEVKAKVGDTVKKGDVLATGTNADLAAEISTATNDLSVAKIQLATAEDAYADASGTDQLRRTKSDLLNARNAVTKTNASLVDLRQQAAAASVLAPIDGTILEVNVTAGADAPSGAAIVLAAGSWQVTADAVETDVSSLKVGQAAAVTVAALGASLTGKVSAIAPAAETASGSNSVVNYAVTITLDSAPATLKAGMTAEVTVTTASASGVLAVPAAALRGSAGNYSVLVMTNGIPQARPVNVGLVTSSLVEITNGLSAGELVVIGTSSSQRTTNSVTGPGGGPIVVPGGGGGRGFTSGG